MSDGLFYALCIILAFIYFLPTVIAGLQQRRNTGAIFALNLVLGWSLLGWVAALIWSLTAEAAPVAAAPVMQTRVRCPHCAEAILPAATVCKHCGRDVKPSAPDGHKYLL